MYIVVHLQEGHFNKIRIFFSVVKYENILTSRYFFHKKNLKSYSFLGFIF